MTLGCRPTLHGMGIEMSRVKVTESIILHNDTSFQTTIAFHSHSLDDDTRAVQRGFELCEYILFYLL